MNCTQARQLIHLHVGDDLARSEALLLDTHIRQCPVCSSHHSAALRSMAALHTLRDAAPEPAASLWPSISLAIRSQLSRHPATRRFNLQVAAVSVCSLLLAVATIVQTLQSLRPASDFSAGWMSTPVGHLPSLLGPGFHDQASLTPQNHEALSFSPSAGWPDGAQDF